MVATVWTAGPETKQLGRGTDTAVPTYVVRAAAEGAVLMLATWMRFQIGGGIRERSATERTYTAVTAQRLRDDEDRKQAKTEATSR